MSNLIHSISIPDQIGYWNKLTKCLSQIQFSYTVLYKPIFKSFYEGARYYDVTEVTGECWWYFIVHVSMFIEEF